VAVLKNLFSTIVQTLMVDRQHVLYNQWWLSCKQSDSLIHSEPEHRLTVVNMQIYRWLTDTSDQRHFGIKTVRHWCQTVCRTLRHQCRTVRTLWT